MSAAGPYVDTSALAKWYLPEPGAEQFEAFVAEQPVVVISRLVVVELHALLNRRHRARELERDHVARVISIFEKQIADGYFELHSLEDRHAVEAVKIVDRMPQIPLRTLDALHLATALDAQATQLATADRALAAAADALGIESVLIAV